MSELPKGWVVGIFGELNEFTSRTIDPASRPEETFELYSVPSFPGKEPEHPAGSAIGSTKQTVTPNDVLVCKINPRINRVWTVGPKNGYEQIASSEWIGFRSRAVASTFANHYFNSPDFRELLCSEVAGVGGSLTRAQPKKVATYPIPIPPLDEQTRIADQLDKLLARIQTCSDRLDTIPALLKRFRQAVLSAAISGELCVDLSSGPETEPSGGAFPMVSLRSVLAEPLRNGKSVRDGNGPPVLRLTSLKAGCIDLSETKLGDWSSVSDITRFLVQNGDYLVSRGNGSKDLVGRGGLVSGCREDIAFPDTMIRIRPDAERVHPGYLNYVWSSQLIRLQIEQAAKTTAGIWKVSQPDLENIRLPLPTLNEQREIVLRVEALFQLADRIEVRYAAARTQAQRMTPLLLAKAFRGELVQQDPHDEPASVLLERIVAAPPAKARISRGRPRIQPEQRSAAPEPDPTDWASQPDGAWSAPADPDGHATMLWLTAVLRAWREPMPEREARLAALLCQQPRLFSAVLPAAEAMQWSRLVGDEARPLPTQVLSFRPAIDSHWGRAIKGMRARDDLVETGLGDGITWALGAGTAGIETAGWPDGRAGFVVAHLRAHGIASVLPLLEPSAQEFVDAKAA